MLDTEQLVIQFAHRSPFAIRLARLAPQTAAAAAGILALAEGLAAKGLFGWEEWQAKLAEIWRRDFGELARALWERLDAANEGHFCQKECGARCCHSACLVLSPREAATLRQRGRELGMEVTILGQGGLAELGDGDPMKGGPWMLPAFPCPFLSPSKLCQVYPDRPGHCQGHPRYWREECALSHQWYFPETNVARQPLKEPPPELLERLAELTRPH